MLTHTHQNGNANIFDAGVSGEGQKQSRGAAVENTSEGLSTAMTTGAWRTTTDGGAAMALQVDNERTQWKISMPSRSWRGT